MDNKKVLGLDLGTNSIGAALINIPDDYNNYGTQGNIEWMGSRIIPMDGEYLNKFESGSPTETKAAFRRGKRGARRLKHRYKLRRTRLIKVFKALGWINDDFPLDESRQFKQSIKENGYSLKISDYMAFSDETIKEFEIELGIEGLKSKKKSGNKGGNSIVPEDWIIYYLRKKALTKKIEISELVRLLYMLNQRRGFKSSRKDLKETTVLQYDEFEKIKNDINNELYINNDYETQFVSITKVNKVRKISEERDKKGNLKFGITVEDKRIIEFEISRKIKPEWENNEYTFLVTQKIKKGKFEQLQPKTPTENDWSLCTTALSEKIENNKQHPGEYFFNELKKAYLDKRNYKIRQYPVYRWRYQNELKCIWETQCKFNPELKKLNEDKNILTRLAEILYPTQTKYKLSKLSEFKSNDLHHIISNDIIYYQRELKSQKNLISECRYEKRKGIDGEIYGLKCIPRSSPLFQEFRIWQDIHNIKILKREEIIEGKTRLDIDVSSLYINESIKEKLFELFNSKLSISEEDILKLIKANNNENDIIIVKKGENHSHRINLFVNRNSLKGNETKARYRNLFNKCNFNGESILNDTIKLTRLWHIDYSITSTDEEKSIKGFNTALSNSLNKRNKQKEIQFNFPQNVIDSFSKLSELKKEYGSYSALAIKKLLIVMRCGKYWTSIEELIKYTEKELIKNSRKETENYLKFLKSINPRIEQIKERLDFINYKINRINEIADDEVEKQVLKSFIKTTDLTKGVNTYQAGYLLYNKHSEREKKFIKNVEEFNNYIQKEIPNNSLRNPIVEQVVRETMYLVRDVWKKFGDLDEIHIELGRDLKNNSEQKFKISEQQKLNNEDNQRIKKLLYELLNGFDEFDEDGNIRTVRFTINPNPESQSDIEKFKIWKENSIVYRTSVIPKKNGDKTINLFLSKDIEFENLFRDSKKEKVPSKSEIKKYILWLSQKCRSPYSGKIIPLSKLFDKNEYEVEHIIPRSKMANDSYNNLVITEAAINPIPYKGNLLARNFISQFGGKNGKEYVINNKKYFILGEEEYEVLCKNIFKNQKAKLKNLLATEVPEDFVERQLNDTRYIGKKLSELLEPVTRNKNGIIFSGGSITFELKKNWGLNDVWKNIIRPRFERLENITGNKYIIIDKEDKNKFHYNISENPNLEIKRIDHRHHALDALIVAATTKEHIRYLNSLSAADTNEEIKKYRYSLVKGKIREFKVPWAGFTKQAKDKLEELIVTFKTNNKIISKPQNRTAYYNNNLKKSYKPQKPNNKWMAVRKSMFKEPLGVISIKKIKEVNVYDAFEFQIQKRLYDLDLYSDKRKTATYIYDKQARKIINEIIDRMEFSIDETEMLLKEIKLHLEKNSKKIPTNELNKNGKLKEKKVYILNGFEYDKITVAYFESYKTKRMPLTKKEYVENLSIEKMKNDFPYFSEDKKRNNELNNLFLNHILEYKNNPKEAFNPEGIEKLNKKAIDNPKIGNEIKSITRLDGKVELDELFNGGYYETDKGAMAYFVIYENQETKVREGFSSLATHQAIERLVTKKPLFEERIGFDKIILSPGDLVYLPTIEECESIKKGVEINKAIPWKNNRNLSKSIYKMIRCTEAECHFTPFRYINNKPIIDSEFGANNCSEKAWDGNIRYKENKKGKITRTDSGRRIKDFCIKLKVDRLGNITPVI